MVTTLTPTWRHDLDVADGGGFRDFEKTFKRLEYGERGTKRARENNGERVRKTVSTRLRKSKVGRDGNKLRHTGERKKSSRLCLLIIHAQSK